MSVRSYLYVPADRPDMLRKAGGRGADALILDLEDSVVWDHKEVARANLTTALEEAVPGAGPTWARVNGAGTTPGRLSPAIVLDLQAVVRPGLAGVVVAKSEVPEILRATIEYLREIEDSRGMGAELAVVALIESGAGLAACEAMAGLEGITRLQLGEADLSANMGLEPSDGEEELLFARSRVVMASAAAGLQPPVGSVSRDISDLVKLRASSERLRRLGFVGRAVVHPAQIGVVHEVFTPSPERVAAAERLVRAAEDAARSGRGALLDEQGRLVDEAVVRAARRVLELGGLR